MKFTALFLAASIAAVPLAANAQVPAPATLTVGGDGLVSRSPDRARVSVDIVTNDDAAARSGGKNTTAYNAFIARLATLGLGAADVRTTSYNVNFVPPAPRNLPPEQRQARYGYVTSRSLSVNVAPLENAGKVVDAATASGVTNVGDVTFDLKDRHGAYLAALAAAMNDAKSTAAAVAAAGSFRLLRVRSVSTGYEQQPLQPYPVAVKRMSDATAPEPPTEIAPNGPIDVTAHVSVTYEIQ